jgi:hypothetical protein
MQNLTGHAEAVDVYGPLFLSYRQSDGTDTVSSLGWLLRAAGIPIWRDKDDLPPGDTAHRLEQALNEGLSGGVLVVTPDVALSEAVKTIEAPGLIQLHADDDRFQLLIANEVSDATGKQDYSSPDRLLGRTQNDLKGVNQYSTTTDGLLQLVQAALWHRMAQHREDVTSSEFFDLTIQTRNIGQVYDRTGAQLDIRVRRSTHPRLPSSEGLHDLGQTLSMLPDAITRTGAHKVRVLGGAHLTVAYALGAAMPSSRVGCLQVIDQRGDVWMSGTEATLGNPRTLSCDVTANDGVTWSGRPRVAIYVDLLPLRSDAAYAHFIDDDGRTCQAHAVVRPLEPELLNPNQAGALVAEIAAYMRQLSGDHDNAEIHLLLRCPFPIAVLLGRLSNTMRVCLYEWDDTALGEDYRSRYVATLDILASAPSGPITNIHL